MGNLVKLSFEFLSAKNNRNWLKKMFKTLFLVFDLLLVKHAHRHKRKNCHGRKLGCVYRG